MLIVVWLANMFSIVIGVPLTKGSGEPKGFCTTGVSAVTGLLVPGDRNGFPLGTSPKRPPPAWTTSLSELSGRQVNPKRGRNTFGLSRLTASSFRPVKPSLARSEELATRHSPVAEMSVGLLAQSASFRASGNAVIRRPFPGPEN